MHPTAYRIFYISLSPTCFLDMADVNPFKRLPIEVFLMILEESLYLDSICTAHYTIATRLARTCRDFLEPSRDIIWRQIPHIAVLFYLLPQDMWKLEEVIVPGPVKLISLGFDAAPKRYSSQTTRSTVVREHSPWICIFSQIFDVPTDIHPSFGQRRSRSSV